TLHDVSRASVAHVGAPLSLHSFPTRRSSDLDLESTGSGPHEAFRLGDRPSNCSRADLIVDQCVCSHVTSPRTGCMNCLQPVRGRSEEHTSELQSRVDLVCRLLLEKKKQIT